MSCDVVIPAHNEAETIGAVVDACVGAGAWAVIVVADDCSDETEHIAEEHGAIVRSVGFHNKGSAMAAGLELVMAGDVLFCDADLSGLTPEIVRALMDAPPHGGQVVGLTESELNIWSKLGLPPITGERRLPADFARTIPMASAGYKVELLIDARVAKAGLAHKAYEMPGVTNPTRIYEDPVGWAAMWADLGITSLKYAPDLLRYTLSHR